MGISPHWVRGAWEEGAVEIHTQALPPWDRSQRSGWLSCAAAQLEIATCSVCCRDAASIPLPPTSGHFPEGGWSSREIWRTMGQWEPRGSSTKSVGAGHLLASLHSYTLSAARLGRLVATVVAWWKFTPENEATSVIRTELVSGEALYWWPYYREVNNGDTIMQFA